MRGRERDAKALGTGVLEDGETLARLIRNGSFLEEDRREIRQRRRGHHRLGFAYQSAFVRVVGRFPRQERLETDEESLRGSVANLSKS